ACFVTRQVDQLLLQHLAAALDEGNAAQGAGGARADAGAIGDLGRGGDTHPAAGRTDLNPATAGARKGANSDDGQSSTHGFLLVMPLPLNMPVPGCRVKSPGTQNSRAAAVLSTRRIGKVH